MKHIRFLFLALYLMVDYFLNAEDHTFDDYHEYWRSAVESSKDFGGLQKAIENYTSAIQMMKSDQSSVLLNLVIERGNIYLKSLDYNNALKDFTFALDHPAINRDQKIAALWRRNITLLPLGKIREYVEGCDQLELLEPSVTTIEENGDYAIYKLGSYMREDPKGQELFIKLLMARKDIKSEKDATFTPSGLVIVKNSP